GHPDRPAFLADLAGALLHRATQTGDGGAAIATARAAADACPAHHPHRPRILLLLGRALSLNPSPRAADEAVTVLREAIAADQEPRFQAEAHAALSDALRHRADLGTEAETADYPADLDPAVQAADHPADLDVAVQAA